MYFTEGKSFQEIAAELHCSVHKIQYWMQKFRLKVRSKSEAGYLKHNPNGDPFKIKQNLNRNDLILLGLGLGLWWGEGSKKHAGTIRLGNTDPFLIQRFIGFLETICGVSKAKFRFGLQVFNDVDPKKAKAYWQNILNVDAKHFLPKVVISTVRGEGTYKTKANYGVLTLYCSNTKLRKELDMLMQKFAYKSGQ